MSVRINKEKCLSCGRCRDACPGNLIELGADGAYIERPEDCWGCASCLKECKASAIDFFLYPDIGGRGYYMRVNETEKFSEWKFYDGEDLIRTITVDKTISNKY